MLKKVEACVKNLSNSCGNSEIFLWQVFFIEKHRKNLNPMTCIRCFFDFNLMTCNLQIICKRSMSNSTSSEQNCPPDPSKICWKYFYIFVTPKYDFQKIFSPSNGIGNFWAQFQVTLKIQKHCFGQFEVQTNLERLLRYTSEKTHLINFQNTISHVKFPEEFESFIRIQVRVKALPKNCADGKKHEKNE